MKITKAFFVSIQLIVVICNSQNKLQEAGIIIGSGVRVRKDSTIKAKVIFDIPNDEAVGILGVSARKDSVGGSDTCSYYPWVRVKLRNGIEGWIFGKFVFRLLLNDPLIHVNPKIPSPGEDQFLVVARNYSLGSSIEYSDGNRELIGCEEFYPVFLVTDSAKMIKPVAIEGSRMDGYSWFKYWKLIADIGRIERIVKVEKISDNDFTVKIEVEFQEGCASYEIVSLNLWDDYPFGTVQNFLRKYSDAECNNR